MWSLKVGISVRSWAHQDIRHRIVKLMLLKQTNHATPLFRASHGCLSQQNKLNLLPLAWKAGHDLVPAYCSECISLLDTKSHTRLLDSLEQTDFVVTGPENPAVEHPSPWMPAFVWEMVSCCNSVAQASLKVPWTRLPQPLEFWDYKHEPPNSFSWDLWRAVLLMIQGSAWESPLSRGPLQPLQP